MRSPRKRAKHGGGGARAVSLLSTSRNPQNAPTTMLRMVPLPRTKCGGGYKSRRAARALRLPFPFGKILRGPGDDGKNQGRPGECKIFRSKTFRSKTFPVIWRALEHTTIQAPLTARPFDRARPWCRGCFAWLNGEPKAAAGAIRRRRSWPAGPTIRRRSPGGVWPGSSIRSKRNSCAPSCSAKTSCRSGSFSAGGRHPRCRIDRPRCASRRRSRLCRFAGLDVGGRGGVGRQLGT